MGIFDLFKNSSKKQHLLEWQNFIIAGNSPTLKVKENQLREMTKQQAENDLRIINDCKNLVETTLNPDVFFMRLNLLVEKAEHLSQLEKYISFSCGSAKDALDEINNNYQQAINQFIVRYFIDTLDKADNLKTEKGKKGRYQKFYNSLKKYYIYMNDENIGYIESKYSAYMLNV